MRGFLNALKNFELSEKSEIENLRFSEESETLEVAFDGSHAAGVTGIGVAVWLNSMFLFAVGFPALIPIGLVMLTLTVVALLGRLEGLWYSAFKNLQEILLS